MHYVPNAITLARVLLIPLIAWWLLQERYDAALLCVIVSALSDLADGAIARRWNVRTRFGAIADPVADKLTMLTVTVLLAWQQQLPLWLAAAIVLRDVVIVGGAVAYHFVVGQVEMAPTRLSKFNTALEFAVLVSVLAQAAEVWRADWLPLLFAVLIATVLASGLHYVWAWSRKAWRHKAQGKRKSAAV